MDLAQLKAGVADVEVMYKQHTFTVGYRPEAMTEDDLAIIEQFREKSGVELLRATVAPIQRLVLRWSIKMGEDPLPINEESITFLPPRMRVSILEAIMGDFFGEGNAPASVDGSSAGAVSGAIAPSSPLSSGTPNGLVSPPGSLQESLTPVGA